LSVSFTGGGAFDPLKLSAFITTTFNLDEEAAISALVLARDKPSADTEEDLDERFQQSGEKILHANFLIL
jgi:hypothetical protein